MKTSNVWGWLLLFCAISLVSCNDDDSNKWYDSMPDGGPFYTGNVLRFYYVDEAGNDLIKPEDLNSLPVSSAQQTDTPPVIDAFDYNYRYNSELNNILYNEQTGLYEFFTYALGDSRHSHSTFYVYYRGVADKMDVVFRYQADKVNNGQFYASNIQSWSVNGVEVYNVERPAYRKYVYLVKKADGTTNVELRE